MTERRLIDYDPDIVKYVTCPKCRTEHHIQSDRVLLEAREYGEVTNSCPHCQVLLDPLAKPLKSLKDPIFQAEHKLRGECPECGNDREDYHAMWCSRAVFYTSVKHNQSDLRVIMQKE